jgi:cob(I)alamin adenosyltransferase
MGHRLSRIYTRTGDDGSTGLGDGTRIAKTAPRVAAMGDVDEVNSLVGLLLTESLPAGIAGLLKDVQHGLFDLGGELSIPGMTLVSAGHVAQLEAAIDALNAELPPLKEFILPGGSRAAAICHLCRAVCRRAERSVTRMPGSATRNRISRIFLNRLSDLLFVLARVIARRHGGGEVLWEKGRLGGESHNLQVTSHKSNSARSKTKKRRQRV